MKKTPRRRDQELLVYLSQEELDQVKRAALVDDRSASAWTRRLILDYVGRHYGNK